MPTAAKMRQCWSQPFDIVKQITEDNDRAAPFRLLGQMMQKALPARLIRWLVFSQLIAQHAQCSAALRGGMTSLHLRSNNASRLCPGDES